MSDNALDFEKIYRDFRPQVTRYLARLSGNAEAEDLVQEVFTRVSGGLASFRGESSLATWIYRIASNVVSDKRRRLAVRSGVRNHIALEDMEDEEPDKAVWIDGKKPSTEQRLIRQEMNDCIRGIVDALPEKYQSVIILSELEGFCDAEIAEILGLSLEAAKIRLHRARTRLREELKKECVFYHDDDNEFACDRRSPLIQIAASPKK